ncbi:hypothetical protein PR202_gb29663 [Eleusine coracana subsp. coracana]|uniref:RRM domain-containing protein n=1 Tax=Eleusine coracana subsp. coracana TaxID=191504 RepID=A0AAV5G080_ELECO|nr:hypothetical protein PR202_gb29663 [Eleusine coracana subsp. coracana]
MAREAEPDAEQQLSRRRRRLFSAEERSFRMDRRSPAAAALRAAVADVLPRFLDSYSDETLENHDAFTYPGRLWGFLSKRNVESVDNCSFQDRLDNQCENLNGKKNLWAAKDHPGIAQIKDWVVVSAFGRTSIIRGISPWRACWKKCLYKCLPEALGTDDERMSMSLKRRPVWDRLGKPIVEDHGLVRTHVMTVQNGLHKKAKLMVPEHVQRYCADSYSHHDVFDKANPRKFTNCHTDVNTGQAHEHVGRANKSRLIGRLSFDGGRMVHDDMDRNNIQEREVLSQKSSLSLPVKSSRLQSMNEFTSKMKGLPASVPEPTRDVFRSSKGCSPALSNTPSSVREDGSSCRNKPVKEEILDMKLKIKQMELDVLKLRSKQMQINIEKQGSLSLGPHANFDEDSDSRTVLVTNVHFAATKEALSTHFMKCGTVLNINILMDAITGHPKGAAYITFADEDSIEKAVSLSGTSFLTRVLTVCRRVHFILDHISFLCDIVADANIYFFSVDIFCFQVIRKADAPPGLLASVQQPWSPLQPWSPPPFQKGSTPKQASKYHLQWKREQSVLEKSPAN